MYTLIEVSRITIRKKPHVNTLTVQTWDLMLPRPGRILVTNPDRQLPCRFSKTVLGTPSYTGGRILQWAFSVCFFSVMTSIIINAISIAVAIMPLNTLVPFPVSHGSDT